MSGASAGVENHVSMTTSGTKDDSAAPRRGELSDLIGVEFALVLIVGLLVVFAGFFFVGPVVGVVLLLAGIAACLVAAVAVIRRAEAPDERVDGGDS